MAWFEKPSIPEEQPEPKRVRTEGLWIKCDSCRGIIWKKDLEAASMVCPTCGFHFKIDAKARLNLLFDDETWEEFDQSLRSTDALGFVDQKPYTERLAAAEQSTGLKDAIICAQGKLAGRTTIICAMDFSPPSYTALNHALSLAQRSQGRLVLLHVLDWPPDRPMPAGLGPATAGERRLERDTAIRELRMAVPEAARDWCEAEPEVRIGRPHEEVVRLAHEIAADLIVLGVHGRSALTRPFVGSTATQVVRHAECPVLTVR